MGVKVLVLSEFLPEAMLAAVQPDVLESAIYDVVSGARAEWVRLAGQRLHSSRRDYINGIQEVKTAGGETSVSLVGALAVMREEGASAFDMHETLLGPDVPLASPGHPGKRINKKGQFYRAIPFRHQGPNSAGQGGGAPMGSAYAGHPEVANAMKLGRTIYKAAKALAPSGGMPGGPVAYGGRLPAGLAPILRGPGAGHPGHSTDIYAGMIKSAKTYENATQGTYHTFRMISDSVPDKWHHPGIQAANIADEVVKYVETMIPLAIGALLQVDDD